MRRYIALSVFVLCVPAASLAQIKKDFAVAIDPIQIVARTTGEARTASGAHFTLFRVGESFHFGGIGAGIDMFASDGVIKLNKDSQSSFGTAPYVSLPIISVRDNETPNNSAPLSIGFALHLIYDIKLKDKSLGISITLPLRFGKTR